MKKISIVFIFIFFLVSCGYNNNLLKEINQCISTIEVIDTEIELSIDDKLKSLLPTTAETEFKFNEKATSFHVGFGYVLALTHATSHKNYVTVRKNGISFDIPIKILKYEYKIDNDPIELIGRVADISLFKTNIIKEPIPWGDSDNLELGTEIIIVGNSLLKGINLKRGIVSKIELNHNYELNDFYLDVFLIDAAVYPGDSGSPVLAVKNNKYVIIGVVYATYKNNMGLCFKSNYVKNIIQQLKNRKNDN